MNIKKLFNEVLDQHDLIAKNKLALEYKEWEKRQKAIEARRKERISQRLENDPDKSFPYRTDNNTGGIQGGLK